MTDTPTGWDAAVAVADPAAEEVAPAEVPAEAPAEVPAEPEAPAPEPTAPEPDPEPEAPLDLRQAWLCVTPEGTRTLYRGPNEDAPSVCPQFQSDAHLAGELVTCPHCGKTSVVKLQDWVAGRQRLGLPA